MDLVGGGQRLTPATVLVGLEEMEMVSAGGRMRRVVLRPDTYPPWDDNTEVLIPTEEDYERWRELLAKFDGDEGWAAYDGAPIAEELRALLPKDKE